MYICVCVCICVCIYIYIEREISEKNIYIYIWSDQFILPPTELVATNLTGHRAVQH